jgi:hypothetical protein
MIDESQNRRNADKRHDCNDAIRLYFCCSTFVASIISITDPLSLGWQLVTEVGWPADLVMYGLAGISFFGILDAVINDFLPDSYRFPVLRHYRDFGYMVMAAIYAAFVFMAVQRGHTSLLLVRYLVDMSACVYVAVCDVNYRYLMPRKRRAAEAKGGPWPVH